MEKVVIRKIVDFLQKASVKAEVATGYAKHGNAKTELVARFAEVATGYAKHGNVKTEATATIAEVATGYAKHGNVKTEATATIAEVATEKLNSDRLF